jgi:subtilisin/minor extracellular protease Epr
MGAEKLKRAITSAIMACLILASVLTISVVTAQPAEKVPVIVGFKDKPDADLIQAHGGRIKCVYNIISAIACELPEPAIEALRKNPKVAYVEGDGVVEAIGEVLPWGVDRIDAEVVHPYNKGTAVKVAIIDTGIDYTHPDLNDNYKGGYDFVNVDADPKDDNGHGTHCAGIVAAEDNDIGVIGVAPEAYLYAVKVLNNQGSGYLSNVILGIEWSVTNGMQVVSMSLGTSTYSQSLKDACNNAYNAGLVLVAAAGNSGDGNPATDEYSYPAAYDSVIAVGATDKLDTAPSWSNSGPYLELAAPGVSIYSTLPTYRVTLTRTYGYSYGTLSGTSMSCPHVAGTVALVIASDQTLTNVGVRTRLQTTADDLGPIKWDTVYGYGIVDADEAAPLTGPPNQPPVADANGPYTGTEDVAITFNGLDSYDPDNDPLTYAWSFGDGNTGTGVNPTHVYTAGETYTVTLVVNDGKVDSEPSYSTATIAEVNDPPIADAGPDQTATINEVITFDGSGSTDPEGNIASYAWDFGDGTSGTGITVTHAYSTAGTYTVTLTVTDDGGLTDSDTAIVTVTEAPAVPTMHVFSIKMSTGSRTVGRNKFVWATATVTIVDAKDVPVGGATVYGHWEIATTDSDSGITDVSGQVSLQSDSVKNPPSGTTFKFVVDRVELSGWTYNSSANVETSDSITF